nr:MULTISPECIES: cobalamin B12-binding domain-containing protein [Ramlibacter]
MRIEQRCAVELLRARTVLVNGLLQRSPAFGPSWPHWFGDETSVSQCSAEAEFHILQLAAALRFARRELFVQHVRWLRVVLTHRGLSDKAILLSLGSLVELARDCLPAGLAGPAAEYVRAALLGYHAERDPPSLLAGPLQAECLHALLAEVPVAPARLLAGAARAGLDGDAYGLSVLVPALHEVGRLWQVDAIGPAQEQQCTARAAQLLEHLSGGHRPAPRSGRTAVCACVVGERHELGLRMVAGFLRAAGWTVSCPDPHQDPAGLLRAVIGSRASLVAISATMLQHLHALESVIAALRAMRECAHVPVLVGGQAFETDPGIWREIGADGTAADAREAVVVADRLVEESESAAAAAAP